MLYDVIIIGSGPAGLSAAIYAERAKLKTLVLEKAPMSGGQILNTYEVVTIRESLGSVDLILEVNSGACRCRRMSVCNGRSVRD